MNPRRRSITLAAIAAIAASAPAAAQDASPEYQRALDLGSQAYVYGIPLVNMDKTFRSQTSVNVSDERGNGPVNQFNHVRHIADPLDRTVVSPNADTLYSIAWIDLKKGPVVVRTPKADRFHVMPLYTPYQENIANIGSGSTSLPDGAYAITPPGWKGKLPAGLEQIRAPYDRLWTIVRIVIRGKADEPAVQELQDQYEMAPLSRWRKGTFEHHVAPGRRDTELNPATIPGAGAGEDPLAFYDALGDQLERFDPQDTDDPLLEQLAQVGIGPGMRPSTSRRLSAETLRGLRDGVALGRQKVDQNVQKLFVQSAMAHNGWLVTRTGNYGTDYVKRAVVDKIGLGALRSELAVYPFTQVDSTFKPLSGANRYVVHFPAASAQPPVDAFWSLTMYDAQHLFVPNAINRYVLNDRSDLHYNADGSLDFYVQRDRPTDPEQAKNWLPTPEGAFNLMFRLYQITPSRLAGVLDGTGWTPGTVLACSADGTTTAGVTCAA